MQVVFVCTCEGGADSKIALHGLCHLILMPLHNLLFSVGRIYDLLLTDRIWQWWWVATSMNRLHKSLTCFLFLVGFLPCWFWWNKLPSCELSYGDIYMARHWEWPRPTVSKKLSPSFKHVFLEARPSPPKSSDETLDGVLVKILKQRYPLSHA